MTLEEAYAQVEKRKCECIPCDFCRGMGTYRVDFRGNPIDSVADLYTLEYCEECRNGIAQVCDRCRELEELSQIQEEEECRAERRALGQNY